MMKFLNGLVSDVAIASQAIILFFTKKKLQIQLLIVHHKIGRTLYESRQQIPGQEEQALKISRLQTAITRLEDSTVKVPGTFFALFEVIGRSLKVLILKARRTLLMRGLGANVTQSLAGQALCPSQKGRLLAISSRIESVNTKLGKLRTGGGRPVWRPLLTTTAVFVLLVTLVSYGLNLARKQDDAVGGKPEGRAVNGSAHDWARLYQSAKWISDQELLSGISSVELLVSPDSTLSGYYSKDQLFGFFEKAVEAQGIRVQKGSAFKLVAECLLQESAINLHQWSSNTGEIDHTFPVNIKYVGLRFVLTLPVLRGGHFCSLQVAPLCGWSATLGQGRDESDDRIQDFQHLVGQVFDVMRKRNPDENSDEDAWQKAAWPQGEDQKFYQEWVRALGVGPPESERCFINFPRVAKYELDADDTARSNLNWNDYQGQWRQILNDDEHEIRASDQIVFLNEVRSIRSGANVAVQKLFGFESSPYYSNLSAVRIYQANVVFPASKSAGGYFLARRRALVFMGFAGSMCLPADLAENLRQVTRGSMNDVAQEMRYKH